MNKLKMKIGDECCGDIVTYAPYCTRGEIIALLYNNAVREKSGRGISSEVVEGLVHDQLGDARTIDGRIVPNEEGFIDKLESVTLNVYCHLGAIDVSLYPHGNVKALIYELISKRRSDHDSVNARNGMWNPINPQ